MLASLFCCQGPPESDYDEVNGCTYTQRPAIAKDNDSDRTSRNSQSSNEHLADTRSNKSARDSDSGVNSTHSNQTTPQQHQRQQQQQPKKHGTPEPQNRLTVPSAAVNDERDGEEDDDIDELFSHHRPNMYGSRSSLADSRESIYSVYSDAGEVNYGRIPVTGEVMFGLTYNYKSGHLEVNVKQCRDLAAVDTKHNRSDPYVKTYLLPDKSRASKRKTKIKKHTLNPTFDETLKYSISKTELENRTLWLTVWNNDRFGRNDFLGEVTIPMDYYRFDVTSSQWYPLQERIAPPPDESANMLVYKGDLFISLKYVPSDMVESSNSTPKRKPSIRKRKDIKKAGVGEVHALVKEAQNLTAMRGTAGSNPFCKGYLLPDRTHASKQKTPVIKKTTNPQWQHLLVFEGVDQNVLPDHSLELTVWDHETLSSNDFLGGARLNLGQGTCQGKPVDWMDARGEEIEAWQSIMDNPNEWVDVQLPLRASMGSNNVKK